MRLYRSGEVPAGASCAACGEHRSRFLAFGKVGTNTHTLCGNCLLVLRRTRPLLHDLEELVLTARADAQRSAATSHAMAAPAPAASPPAAYELMAYSARGFDPAID